MSVLGIAFAVRAPGTCDANRHWSSVRTAVFAQTGAGRRRCPPFDQQPLHAGLLEGEAAPGVDWAAVAGAAADRDRRTLGGDQLFDLICALIFAVAVRP